MQIYKVGPQPGAASMCPVLWTTKKGPRQGSPLSIGMGRAKEKNCPKRPSDCIPIRGSKKDSDRAITPVVEAVRILVHLALPGSLQAKKLLHLHAQLSLGQSCQRQKKSLASMHAESLRLCSTLCDPVDCGLPVFSVRGVLQARKLQCIGQYWLLYPSRALYFLLP